MTNLTLRQRVAVRAVQTLLHANGHDPKIVSRTAWNNMQAGMTPADAYTTSINHYLDNYAPDLTGEASNLTRLVKYSDDATVSVYDKALNRYDQSEGKDASAINALAPMIARDSVALAVKLGEITPEQAADGSGLETALGYAPTPEIVAALHDPSYIPPTAAPAAPNDSFQFQHGRPPMQPQQPAPSQEHCARGGNLGELLPDQKGAHSWINGTQAPRLIAVTSERVQATLGHNRSQMAAGGRTETGGYRAPMTSERAARWAGTPTGKSLAETRGWEGSANA